VSQPPSTLSESLDDAIHVLTLDEFDTLCGQQALVGMNLVPLHEAHEHGIDSGAGCWTCIEKMEKYR
jgi:hypothetical protein